MTIKPLSNMMRCRTLIALESGGTSGVSGAGSGNLGTIGTMGWDLGQVQSGIANDYFFNSPLAGGSTFTATLTWFRDRRVDGSNNVYDDSFDNLDLELWKVAGGLVTTLVSQSMSLCGILQI